MQVCVVDEQTHLFDASAVENAYGIYPAQVIQSLQVSHEVVTAAMWLHADAPHNVSMLQYYTTTKMKSHWATTCNCSAAYASVTECDNVNLHLSSAPLPLDK